MLNLSLIPIASSMGVERYNLYVSMFYQFIQIAVVKFIRTAVVCSEVYQHQMSVQAPFFSTSMILL